MRNLVPHMNRLTTQEVASLPAGSLILVDECEVFVRVDNRNAPGVWSDPEGNNWREHYDFSKPSCVLIRVGPSWEPPVVKAGDAAAFASAIAEMARNDPALRDALRAKGEELRVLVESIDELDPRTRGRRA